MMVLSRSKPYCFSAAALITVVVGFTGAVTVQGATLPVACVASACGGMTWSGTASAPTAVGNLLTIQQATDRATYNWSSFNISADGKVIFNQPSASAIALNRIYDANPSQIYGGLQANGQVYLINQNGFLFGATARVNTAGLLASSLNITDDIFNNGLLSSVQKFVPALQSSGNVASVVVEPGARITTNADGQRILLAAKTINNQGEITANGGQVVLAAGDALYVNASDDPALRGLLVEVNGGGTVTNTGSVTTERGNITAVGLAINQNGRMSATTSVNENGSIRLLARDTTVPKFSDTGQVTWVAHQGGQLTLGNHSLTEVTADAMDRTTAVNEQEQSPSTVELVGKTVQLTGGSQVLARGGQLNVVAATDLSLNRDEVTTDSNARIRVESGALIDLSGNTDTTSVTRNLVAVELRANELADSPQQRDGVLRGQTVVVDARVGTPLANVDGAINLIGHTVLERTSQGGTATFDSSGDIVVGSNATIDVSGGAVNYAGGVMRTTQLIKADGSTVDIGRASADANYIGLLNPVYKSVSDRWGVTKYISAPGFGNYEAGYIQGSDAGTIHFMGNALALDGNFIGLTTNGARQRTVSSMAKGGQFIVGTNAATAAALSFRSPEIQLVVQSIPTVADIHTALIAGTPLQLSTDLLKNGFTRIQLASDKGIKIDTGGPMVMQAGSSLTLNAPKIEINSDITSIAGQITANAVAPGSNLGGQESGLTLADGTKLDVSGQWVNDTLVPLDQQPSEILFTKGGSIFLQQSAINGALTIGDDVSLRANGGAWMKRTGVVAGGSGGAISIKSNNNNTADLKQSFKVGHDFAVQSFGVEGATGGTFNLRIPRLTIVEDSEWLMPQQVYSAASSGSILRVGSSLFSDYGFSNFTLQADSHALSSDATKTTLDIAAQTQINLAPLTLSINPDASHETSGTTLEKISTVAEIPAYQTMPSNLTLLATTALGNRDQYGGISMAQNSRITGTTDSSVTMTTMGDLTLGGEINIPSGTVKLSVVKSAVDNEQAFVNRQLTVQGSSVIDVSGGTLLRPSDAGLRQGTLSDGGDVVLQAAIGSVNVKQGASINIAGTQAELEQQRFGSTGYTTQSLSTVGGSLFLQGAESIVMQGDLTAQGGSKGATQNTGGTLNVSFTRQLPNTGASTFPTGPRVVQVTQDTSPIAVSGVAAIDADLISQSGIAQLNLSADNQIAIGSGVDVAVKQKVLMDAPELAVLGKGVAKLSAEKITIGPQVSLSSRPAATTAEGELVLSADQIDVTGSLALQTKKATLSSQGAILLEGYGGNANALGGAINTKGDLTLEAGHILPTTGSDFTINASGANSTVTIKQVGTTPPMPMSVAGSLSINAANIDQGGTLVAPFGVISLNARDSLQLLDGSVTSVSGHGSVLPYGRVDNGTSWVWGVNPEDPDAVKQIPDRRIALSGNTAKLSGGALIDVSGGGDLVAYQFTPGTGGKTDALAGVAKGLYAIIPAMKGQAAPYDPMMWAGSGLTPGQSVYLAEGSEIPAGVYQLLPARYALQSGAYLVSAVNGFQDIQPGTTASTSDGAKVVAGYLGFGNHDNSAARYNGFAVRPGSYARQLAQYDDHLASAFFNDQSADTAAAVNLPQDAGVLTVAVQQSLDALATVRGQAVATGVNASVEIQAPVIEVNGTTGGISSLGNVVLSSNTLKNWHVGSLLLGGQRNEAGEVNVGTQSVTLHGGTELVADEVVLAATQGISIESGAVLASTSAENPNKVIDETRFATPTALKLSGAAADQAAVLAVSDLGYVVTEREVPVAANGASIHVATGATVATRGAVAADAVGPLSLATNSIHADEASWSLAAKHLSFGNADTASDGLAMDSALVSNLQTARQITLTSATDLDIHQSVTLGANSTIDLLKIKAGRINNISAGASSFTADRIALNGVGQTMPTLATGMGTLLLSAKEIELGAGQIGLSGFSDATLASSGLLIGKGDGGLSTAGNLSVTSSAITTNSGAHTQIKARSGSIQLTATAGQAPDSVGLLTGGTLDIRGASVVDAARILMPSGVVTVSGTSNLELQGTALIDTSGVKPTLALTGSNGGAIHLNSDGALHTASSTRLNVSGGQQADAGQIIIHAVDGVTLDGTIQGTGSAEGKGGAFSLEAQSIQGFTALSQSVQNGGFTDQQRYRANSGDLTVSQGQILTAHDIELTADNGNVTVNGALIARSQQQRSAIVLNAKNNVVIGDAAVLDASADDVVSQRAGSIQLATTNGHVQMASTTQVKSSGKDGSGTLIVRAPTTANDFNLDSLPSNLSQVDSVILEPMKSFVLTSSTPTLSNFNSIRNDLSTYMVASKAGISNRLGVAGMSTVALRPYADITRIGDLTLPTVDYGVSNALWRFDGQPAAVSIRATGNLTVAGTQSDGFINTASGLNISDGQSIALSLVAGADLTSADYKATVLDSGKDIVLNNNVLIRTGTGNIDMTTSRDIVFGDKSSVYTAGISGFSTDFNSDGASVYADRGGSINLVAGHDVLGHVVKQAVNDWQTHGSYSTSTGKMGAYWGVDYGSFGWNVGALGGGDVSVKAAGNIKDLSAAVADSAAFDQVNNARLALGGGNLKVDSGQDIQSGYFYVGKGRGDLLAWGALSVSGNRQSGQDDLGTFLVSGDARYTLSSTGGILFEGLLHNPALIYTRPAEQELPLFFNRYSPSSSLTLQSTGGDLEIKQNDYVRYKEFGNYEGNDEVAKKLYPASLTFNAFAGQVNMASSPLMAPSSQGGLVMYSSGDIYTDGTLAMSDVLTKNRNETNASEFSDFVTEISDSSDEIIHSHDAHPVYIAAGRDLLGLRLSLPKAAEIKAGRDIVDLSLQGQQDGVATTTLIQAGRDVLMTDKADTREIAVGGKGSLQVMAGRDVNLGFSKGMFTTGNLRNGNLPANKGANVIAIAGLTRPLGISANSSANAQDFITTIIGTNDILRKKLVDFMVSKTGNNSLDFDVASTTYRALSLQEQLPFAVDILFQELVNSGRETNKDPTLAFKRGYAALESLFPGSQLDTNQYKGNVTLPFSRVYSLNGGDIAVLAPGGKIDVGLANTPASLAKIIGNRSASELGIVAQQSGDVRMLADQDVLVNTSRVFTLGGGDIAIWSSKGNIDAGKGAKSAISAPPPTLIVDAAGNVSINFASAVAGSGIRTISTGANITAGDVDLIAPAGFVNAGDAGIGSSGNLNIAAQRVVGLDNIQVGGTSSGVPPETGGLGASLSGVTASASSSTTAASNSVADATTTEKTPVVMADAALSWLEVFVLGLGEENCKQDDLECLKRQVNN